MLVTASLIISLTKLRLVELLVFHCRRNKNVVYLKGLINTNPPVGHSF